jgi:iron(II)-dependent oxidoreductase
VNITLFPKSKKRGNSRGTPGGGEFSPAAHAKPLTDPLEQALQAGRLGHIVGRPSPWADHPRFEVALAEAARVIDERFALVPPGIVSIPLTISDEPGQPEVDCTTKEFLLARCAVTNADFQHFVDAGSYRDMSLWPEEIWPHLLSFKDETDTPGPRYWRDGCHDRRYADHPVVGISYYEAAAYAQWAGYRLPTEAEWQMAASWRIRSAANVHRRYPWGDSLDVQRCNIWAAGQGGTLPVDACPGGAAPNGVLQLIGNVWEWTNSDFLCADTQGRRVVGETRMNSIRGGAFDTYFAWQATATFRTGLACVARSNNVGFRCALDAGSRNSA